MSNNTKTVKTRIQNKHDLEVNWHHENVKWIPLKGELIIYDVEIGVDEGGNPITLQLPNDRTTPYEYERFKIGDGINKPKDLPFVVPDHIKGITPTDIDHWGTAYDHSQSNHTVDAELSNSSTNPVQNKRVTAALANKVDKTIDGVQCIKGGLVVGKDSATGVSAVGNGRIMLTGQVNPLIGVQAIHNGIAKTPYYVQAVASDTEDSLYIGPTSTAALKFDNAGNMTSSANLEIQGIIKEGTQTLAEKYTNVQSDWNETNPLSDAFILNKPEELKNPEALTVGNKTYDGSSAVEITVADLGLANALHFIGTTTTILTDGATANPIIVNSEEYTAEAGDVVLYNSKEFVLTNSAWEELGDESSHALKTISIIAGEGLTGGGTLENDVTISHAVPTGASSGNRGSTVDRTYIKAVTTDKFGHVIGVSTGIETVTDTNTAHSHSVGTGLKMTPSTDAGGIDGDVNYEANLKSTNSLGTIGTTSKLYAVGVDSNGNLAVNVPWTDNNTDKDYSGIAYCSTAAGTAAKTASMPKFALATGQYILLRTSATNSATSSVTLNVNSTGAKPVKIGNSSTNPTALNFQAGDYLANYDGTNWILTRIYATPEAGTNISVDGAKVSLVASPKVTNIGIGGTTSAPVSLQYDSSIGALKFVFS